MEKLVISNLFNGVYKGCRVFITGHTGFKGSWLAKWLELLGAEVYGYSLDPNTEPSHFQLVKPDCESYIDDISHFENLGRKITTANPEIIFHLAAQPLVRHSYKFPIETYRTNVLGSLHLYEACRKLTNLKAIVSVTSDKVYENRTISYGYKEDDFLGGYDIYSSSKACVEILTNSFRRSFYSLDSYKKEHQVLMATARAGNVIGGGDWAEDRLLPDIIRAINSGTSVSVRNPSSTRPWQHVLDPLSGYLLLGRELLSGNLLASGAWNFGPSNQKSVTVKKVLQMSKAVWPKVQFEIKEDKNELHEAGVLSVDSSKAMKLLKWQPVWNLDVAVRKTIDWYKYFVNDRKLNTVDDINTYVASAAKKNLDWAGK